MPVSISAGNCHFRSFAAVETGESRRRSGCCRWRPVPRTHGVGRIAVGQARRQSRRQRPVSRALLTYPVWPTRSPAVREVKSRKRVRRRPAPKQTECLLPLGSTGRNRPKAAFGKFSVIALQLTFKDPQRSLRCASERPSPCCLNPKRRNRAGHWQSPETGLPSLQRCGVRWRA